MDLSLEEQLTAARADRDTYRNAWNRSDERIAELEPALAIVRHLAESSPYAWTSRDDERCFFCEIVKPSDRIWQSQLSQPEHLDACLWLRARKMAGLT